MRTVTVQLPGRPSVAVAFMLRVGSRHEPWEQSGLSHFVEHMVFKGTERFPTPREISETIEGVGGVLDAGTDREATVFWTRVPATELDRALRLLSDMVARPRFTADDVAKERQVVVEELRMYQDSPSDFVQTVFDEVMWPSHPLGRDVAGREETVRGFTREDCAEHMTVHARPETLVVSMAGGVETAHAQAMLERELEGWDERQRPARPDPEPATAPEGDALRVTWRRVEQASVLVGARAPSYLDPRRFAVDILNVVLGEGMSSRLFLELRERRGLVYDVHSFAARLSDSGVLGIGFGAEPRRAPTALRAAVHELRELADQDVGEAELAKAKAYAKGRLALHLEGTSALCEYAGQQLLLTGTILSPEHIAECYDAVTAADVRNAAQDVLRGGLRCAVVGPFRSDARFAAALA
ncbi:MAG: insulinase family protein [Candidatus Dormibacteraeota bacterium]|nr:insulinase family protein [Candidatus Dormibacteraeota bacterium]MBV9525678.1 insulinase family protein [Candidatus Dormibacteraeota bacterium]